MTSLLRSRLPIVAAPMAGGPSTVELADAVIRAGGFAFLAGGNKTSRGLADEIVRLRASLTGMGTQSFGVNLFVPPVVDMDREEFQAYAERLRPEFERFGLEAPTEPVGGDDEWRRKIELLVGEPVPLVSLTFGLPPRADVEALQRAGSTVLATVTSSEEALSAAELGVDGLIVQGWRAGRHSAVHDPAAWPAELETVELLREVRAAVELPLIAAGGVDGPAAVRELLGFGAEAVAVGTLLLRSDEAGTSELQRARMVDPACPGTVLSRAFTGRPARGLRNGFVDRHAAAAPSGYPEVHYLTRPLRQAALRAGDGDGVHLWAGTGFRHAPSGPAAEIVAWLSEPV